MTYRIVPNRRAWWPVIFPGVTEDGEIVENRFELRFNLLDEDEHFELLREAAGIGDKGSGAKFGDVAAPFVERMAADWRGVAAENGDALPFTAENVKLVVRQPGVWAAITRAYAACRKAEPEIREKN